MIEWHIRQIFKLNNNIQINIIRNEIFFSDSMLTMTVSEGAELDLYQVPSYDPTENFGNMILRSDGLPSSRYSMFTNENKKLGYMFNFSLPAIITCPGYTDWCEQHCYANKNTFVFEPVRTKYRRNFIKTQRTDFVDQMIGFGNMLTFRGNPRKTKVLRLHVSGDFYDNEYTENWIQIAKESDDWKIFSYTKSWRLPGMLTKLEELRDLKNVNLFASTDESSGPPPEGWREAAIYGHAHKNDPKDKFLICPEQRGTRKSCIDCKVCFKSTSKKCNIAFIVH